jgi:ankyrin repeat protein
MSQEHEIFDAIRSGDAERVRGLLAEDLTVAGARSDRGHSPVMIAQYRHHHDIVKLLLDTDPPLDVWDASAVGRTSRVAELLDGDPTLLGAYSADGFFPLGLAAYFGHLETARLLLDRGAAVDQVARNPMRIQPLHAATAGGHAEVVALLVAKGAPVNATQQGGWTPLHAVVKRGDAPLTKLLLDHGADPKLQNEGGQSAIGLAADQGDLDLLRLLKQ